MKYETSKMLLWASVIILMLMVICGIILDILGIASPTLQVAIPSMCAVVGAICIFYLNKAKMENIFKGKYKYMRMMAGFKCKVPPDVFDQIEQEMKEIDDAYNNKISTEVSEAVNQNIELHYIN